MTGLGTIFDFLLQQECLCSLIDNFIELIRFPLTIVSTELCHSWDYPIDLFMFFHQNGVAQTQNQAKRGNGDSEEI